MTLGGSDRYQWVLVRSAPGLSFPICEMGMNAGLMSQG